MSGYDEASGAEDLSEDGQVRSPDIHEESFGEAEGTEDSLDIKPPQAMRMPERSRNRRGGYKEKRHSRDHRHRSGHSERPERHERRHGGHHRGDYHHQGPRRHSNDDRGKHYSSRSREMYRKPEHERYRNSPTEKSEADRMLEDLRSHLLSKRHKMEAEMNAQKHQGEGYERRPSKYQHSEKKASSHDRRRDYREHKRNVEDIDSPENYGEHPGGSGRTREGRYEDPEQAARRAKLLEIDRETSRRKEQAREELKARREMRREERRDGQEPVKRHRHDDSGTTSHKKRKHASAEEQVITVSDKSDDTASDSDSSESYEEDSQNSEEEEEDEDIPNSPLSVGDLSKSEHRHRNSSRNSSKSKTHSPASGSGSPSNSGSGSGSSDSKSPGSRDSSKSPTKRNKEDSDAIQRSNIFEEDDEKAEKATEEPAEAKASESGDEKEKVPLADDLPSYYPALQGCRSVEEFQCLNRIEEGTYGVVYRAKDKRTEEIVALKRLKMEKEKEGFPITSLREINTLLKGQHPNIVTVREIVVGSNMDKIFIVMDYVEHDLKSLMETMKHKKQAFLPGEVKCLTQQLLRAVAHLHDIWILHRDLKTSNLLLSHKGILKPYTSVVVTLWYRAPELLLGCKEYSTPIDVWSVGCIFAEFLAMTALFPGKSEIDQLNRIFKDLGTPNEKIWPGYGELPAVQKMTFTEYPGLLTYDPKQRLTAEQALKSHYFKELPLSIDPAMFPTWPAKSELGVRKALASSPKPPSGGGQFKQLGGDDGADNPSGFHLGGSLLESRQLAMGPGFSLKF
uniref:cyclin-dependent kinase n=1 Tax=Phlebotomus papatasi TaxID=29031 RepID=A0A1B0D3R2_PHLPP